MADQERSAPGRRRVVLRRFFEEAVAARRQRVELHERLQPRGDGAAGEGARPADGWAAHQESDRR